MSRDADHRWHNDSDHELVRKLSPRHTLPPPRLTSCCACAVCRVPCMCVCVCVCVRSQRYFKEPVIGCDLSAGFATFIKKDEEVRTSAKPERPLCTARLVCYGYRVNSHLHSYGSSCIIIFIRKRSRNTSRPFSRGCTPSEPAAHAPRTPIASALITPCWCCSERRAWHTACVIARWLT
jgi:hypothetical protein